MAVARRAAGRLGGELVVHDRFGTASVRSAAATFDVVTARTETYAEPGALPDVRPGATIEEDLARRDFTVNAIALRIADGALVEWPGARGDLAAGVLRVLHERSFEDDPTRLLRMARYGARLGFEPDPDTDALAAAATVDDGLGRPARLGAAAAAARAASPRRCSHWSATASGAPSCTRDSAVRRRYVTAALAPVPVRRRAELRGAGDDARGAQPSLRRRSTGSSSTPRRAGSWSRPPTARASSATRSSEPDLDDARPVAGAARQDPRGGRRGRRAGRGGAGGGRRWLTDLRHRRLAITGDDFVAAGLTGPAVGDALEAAQLAALAGEAPGAAEQLAAGLAAVRPS